MNKHRGIEQLAARRAHNPEVAGSSPAPATSFKALKFEHFKAFSCGENGMYFHPFFCFWDLFGTY